MQIYYFIHLTGRNKSNSGIQRVVRNVGAVLVELPDVTVIPVRWCPRQQAVVHAEDCFREDIALFSGPVFDSDPREGNPIHRDEFFNDEDTWLFVPEAPHLGSHDGRFPSMHAAFLLGYARQHRIKTSFIFHDIMPISHFGRAEATDPESLQFVVYAGSLANADLVMPVSWSAQRDLSSWFTRVGVDADRACLIEHQLLPEEMVGVPPLAYLQTPPDPETIEFCMWGSIHPHKNQAAVLEAFNMACERRPDLPMKMHVFGNIDSKVSVRIARAARKANGKIRLHGFVDDETMVSIISRCRASVFVSLVEGYGLPVAESVWMGKPCLTSNIIPMSEVAEGGGCMLVDPHNLHEIARGIEELASDDALIATLKDQITHRKMRRWQDYTRILCDRMRNYKADSPREPYVQEIVRRPMVSMGTTIISMLQLSIPHAYSIAKPPLINNGVMEYDEKDFSHINYSQICFGPYIPIREGLYTLTIDGQIEGELKVKVCTDSGNTILNVGMLDNKNTSFEFVVNEYATDFEIILNKTDNTKKFIIRYIMIERMI